MRTSGEKDFRKYCLDPSLKDGDLLPDFFLDDMELSDTDLAQLGHNVTYKP